MRLALLGLLCFPLIATSSCADDPLPSGGQPTNDTPNFILNVVNESAPRSKIDITVSIDDQVVASGDYVCDIPPQPTEASLTLKPGRHKIYAVSHAGESSGAVVIPTTGRKQYCLVSYWYSPGGKWGTEQLPGFDFRFQDQPFVFR